MTIPKETGTKAIAFSLRHKQYLSGAPKKDSEKVKYALILYLLVEIMEGQHMQIYCPNHQNKAFCRCVA